jgi:hypothetical protein
MEIYTGNTIGHINSVNANVLAKLKSKKLIPSSDVQWSRVLESTDGIYGLIVKPNPEPYIMGTYTAPPVYYKDIFLSILTEEQKNNIITISKDDIKWFSDVINEDNIKKGI